MAALQFVDVPGYSAILFRKTYSDLALPGALMSRAFEWLGGTAARWSSDAKTWTFPSGATLTFGYLDNAQDRYRYQSAEFQFIGFDELTQFGEQDYLYLFSRLRRLSGAQVPLRMRSASNPGGTGHAWVKRRFLSPEAQAAGRVFIPARLEDNPHLDQAQYRKSLENLDTFTKRQLLHGDWSEFEGNHFHANQWPRFRFVGDAYVLTPRRIIMANDLWCFIVCDPATSSKATADPTAALVIGVTPWPDLLILDAIRRRMDISEVIPSLAALSAKWHPAFVGIEEVSFAKLLVRDAARHPDIPPVRALMPKGQGKLARAVPAIVKAERREIHLPDDDPPWLDDFIAELGAFTGCGGNETDDQVDCLAYAVLAAATFRSAAVSDGPILLCPGYGSPFGGDLPYPTPGKTGALGYGSEGLPHPGGYADTTGVAAAMDPTLGWITHPQRQ
jgi:predicted phage terminase large subunit-like protein